ncbi:MAG: 3-deoxy-7-phosphoheptulonate synthase, partial [Kiritimatiellae bacterium]|nr:3-deoxy-7-phosphoheptulonate synthase [Kiritimatiellia bacterium]
MIIVLKPHATEPQIAEVRDLVHSLRYQPRVIHGVERTVVACVGDSMSNRSLEALRNLPTVEAV